jgi:hypothetical protein
MIKPFVLALILALFAVACSDDSTEVEMCECEPDEYCVDFECFKTSDGNIAPAPDEH